MVRKIDNWGSHELKERDMGCCQTICEMPFQR